MLPIVHAAIVPLRETCKALRGGQEKMKDECMEFGPVDKIALGLGASMFTVSACIRGPVYALLTHDASVAANC